MKKRVLIFVPFLLLTSCNNQEIDVNVFKDDEEQKIEKDYNACNYKKEFVDDYSSFVDYSKENFSMYSYYTLFPKDAVRTEVVTPISPVYKIGFNSLNENKNTYFIESYDIYNEELKNMDTSSAGAGDITGPGPHTLVVNCVFYPLKDTEKEYNFDITYSYNKYTKITINGSKSTFGYVYCYCLTDVSVYKDIFINYVKNNLVYHKAN